MFLVFSICKLVLAVGRRTNTGQYRYSVFIVHIVWLTVINRWVCWRLITKSSFPAPATVAIDASLLSPPRPIKRFLLTSCTIYWLTPHIVPSTPALSSVLLNCLRQLTIPRKVPQGRKARLLVLSHFCLFFFCFVPFVGLRFCMVYICVFLYTADSNIFHTIVRQWIAYYVPMWR